MQQSRQWRNEDVQFIEVFIWLCSNIIAQSNILWVYFTPWSLLLICSNVSWVIIVSFVYVICLLTFVKSWFCFTSFNMDNKFKRSYQCWWETISENLEQQVQCLFCYIRISLQSIKVSIPSTYILQSCRYQNAEWDTLYVQIYFDILNTHRVQKSFVLLLCIELFC